LSTLSVTKINTANGTTDLTITTGNTSTGGIVVQSNGNALVLQSNSSTNTLVLYSNGNIGIGNSSPTNTLAVNGTAYISTNTLSLGTSSKAANGYTWLPNGTMLQWFTATVTNTAAQIIAFPTAFPTNCYSLTATPQGAANTMQIGVTIANGTNFTANTITSASKPFYFLAIGA